MSLAGNNRAKRYIDWQVDVETIQSVRFSGQLLAVDKHVNLVLWNCIETRFVYSCEVKRELGLCMLRGETVRSIKPVNKLQNGTLMDGERPIYGRVKGKRIVKKRGAPRRKK